MWDKYLPKLINSLVFPTGIVAVELLISYLFGTLNTFGESQFTLPPLVMTTSIFGVFGLSFLVVCISIVGFGLHDRRSNLLRATNP